MSLRVRSEFGRLRRVLIHRPGQEIDRMVPSLMEQLLFDDILDGNQARVEHDGFAAVLQAAGVETLDPQTLLGEVLEQPSVREEVLGRLQGRGVRPETLDDLRDQEPAAMAESLVAGLLMDSRRARGSHRHGDFYRLSPLPNYFFQRDPQVVFGDRVLVSAMATAARRREPLLSEMVFTHHPALGGAERVHLLPPGSHRGRPQRQRLPMLEGGDVLVPCPRVLMVGLSERTNRRGIEALIHYLQTAKTDFEQLIMVELPAQRSYMHLDTVFTFVDAGLCLAYTPVIEADGGEAGHVYQVDLRSDNVAYVVKKDLREALRSVGLGEVDIMPCGGGHLIDQQREQWTDGANVFALAPGIITVYERNHKTLEELDRRGFRVIAGADAVAGTVEIHGQGPTVITLASHELSRARGGPRCMTMPLERDDLSGSYG